MCTTNGKRQISGWQFEYQISNISKEKQLKISHMDEPKMKPIAVAYKRLNLVTCMVQIEVCRLP